jgi:hypothetical protein
VLGSGMVKAWLLVLFGLLVVAPGKWMMGARVRAVLLGGGGGGGLCWAAHARRTIPTGSVSTLLPRV